jgi:hypothetical protein
MQALTTGFCYLCNEEISDVEAHFASRHVVSLPKPRVPKMSWQHRLDKVTASLAEIRLNESVAELDEVLKELYLIRVRLMELKKQKGSHNGRS